MNAIKICPICESELPPDAPIGVCPRCLLSAGLEGIAGNHLHIRCPHCRHPIEIVDEAADVTCPSCDSRFNLLGDQTIPFDTTGLSKIGRFELLGKLGIGAFGTVWRARDPELDRDVAIKIPRKDQLTLAETELFLREARSAAQLRHPNIVQVHEVGRDEGRVYIVSDLVEGMTLADRLTAGRPTNREAADLVTKLASAVAVAHTAGIVHRDLKPSNVLLDDQGEPHVTDFGLAKREAGEITITIEGRVLGTPAYMSPEQARGDGHAADSRSDVYSLGVILFELLTGEKPFRGNTTMLLHQVMHDDPPRLCRLDGTVPRDLETICLKCLEKAPSRRYQTARALATDLGLFLTDDPIHARPISRMERTRRWCGKHKLVSMLAIAVVASLLSGLMTTMWQWRVASNNFVAAEAARGEEQIQRELAIRRGQETQQALDGAQTRLSRLFAERGMRNLDRDPHASLPWLLAAYETSRKGTPSAAMHRLRLGLMIRNVPDFAGFWPEARAASFSPTGKHFAVAVANDTLVFELPSMRLVGELQHDHEVVGVDFYPDGKHLLTRCKDLSQNPGDAEPDPVTWGRVWNTLTASAISPSRGLNDLRVEDRGLSSFEAHLAPDGKRLFLVNYAVMNRSYSRMSIRIVDATSLELLGGDFAHHHKDEEFTYRVSPDRKKVLTLRGVPYTGKGESEEEWPQGWSNPRIWDTVTGLPITPTLAVPLSKYGFVPVAFDTTSKRVAIGGEDGVYLFDVESGMLLKAFPNDDSTRSVLFHPDGKHLIFTDEFNFQFVDIETGKSRIKYDWRLRHQGLFRLDPNGQRFVLGNGSIEGWELETDVPESSSIADPYQVIFSADGSRIFAERNHSERIPGRAMVLRAADGFPLTPPWRFDEGRQPDERVLSHDGRFLTRLDDVGVWLWDLDTRPRLLRPLTQFEEKTIQGSTNDGRVNASSKSLNNDTRAPERLIVRRDEGRLKVVDESTDSNLVELQGNVSGSIASWCISPNRHRIAVVFKNDERIDRTVEIRQWDLRSGAALAAPMSEPTATWNPIVAYRPDGMVLAIAGNDELRLWDADLGLPLTEPLPFVFGKSNSRETKRLWFTSGGERLYVGRGQSTWVLPLTELAAASPPDNEIVQWSDMLSAHRVDEAGGYVPLTIDEIRDCAREVLGSHQTRISE